MNRFLPYLLICTGMLLNCLSFAQNNASVHQKLEQHLNTLNASSKYPTARQIQMDLIGHSLSEAVENGYRPEDWKWTIAEGEISDFRIIEVITKTKSQYVLTAQMKLSNGYYAYNAKVKIKYINTAKNQWKMDYAVSQGMYIIVTHEYDEFIKAQIVEDGWGGTYCVRFTNTSEVTLCIGGDVLTYNGWQRFTVVTPPHKNATAGGLFSGGSVLDYRINFIVRIN